MSMLPSLTWDHPNLRALLKAMSDVPEQFLESNNPSYQLVQFALPILFRFIKQMEPTQHQFGTIDELYVEGFDSEQIWAQIQELNTNLFHTQFRPHLEYLEKNKMEVVIDDEDMEENEERDQANSGTESPESEEEEENKENKEGMEMDSNKKKDKNETGEEKEGTLEDRMDPKDPFGFYAEDAKAFSDNDESEELEESEQEEVDETSLDEEAAQCMYDDFFGKAPPETCDVNATVDTLDQNDEPLKTKMSNLFLDEFEDIDELDDDLDEEEEEVSKNENLSTFERASAKMQKEIDTLEREAVKEKQWTLKGEVHAKHRPMNSLLEEVVEFDFVRKPVPVVSETYTKALEEMIQNRILAGHFDDVKATLRPDTPVFVPKKPEVSDAPSKVSLADLYAQEYMDQIRGSKPSAMVEALTEQHKEIEQLEKDLFTTLDALTNVFYTARNVTPVVSNPSHVPALHAEEAIPDHVSDAMTKAPFEIFKPSKQIKGDSELTSNEKSSLRRKAKSELSTKRKRKEKQKELLNQKKENSSSNSTTSSVNKLLQKVNVTVLNDENRDLKKRKAITTTGAQLRL